MARLKVLKVPDPRLKKTAEPVAAVTDEIRGMLDDMLETMYADDGVGLAGNQVGILKRLIVLDCGEKDKPEPLKLVNPEILEASPDVEPLTEGCLSVPEQWAEVIRPKKVRFRYLDENGKTVERETTGLLAHCLQHEIDHLNGILFVDKLSPLRRGILLRRALKLSKS